jgi:hypothetical protein
MEYSKILIYLLEPFPTLQTIESDTETNTINPKELGVFLRARLETLVRILYVRHSFTSGDPAVVDFLLMLGSMILRDHLRTQSLEASECVTLYLCAKGLRDHARNDYLAVMMFNVLHSMVDKDDAPVLKIFDQMRSESKLAELRREYINTEWPVHSWVDSGNRRLGELVKEWAGLLLEDGSNASDSPLNMPDSP